MSSLVVSLHPQRRQTKQPVQTAIPVPRILRQIRYRNKHDNKNAIVLISGDTGEGKSRFLGWMIETLDPGFIQSWQNGMPRISISPVPFIEALRNDLLPPQSWWFIDEPRDVKNVNWHTEVAQAVRDVLTEYRFKIVNLGVCTTLRKKLQNDLRDLAHYWVRMDSPGNCEVRKFKPKLKWFHGEAVEVRVPRLLERIRHVPMPSDEFERLYVPLKESNFRELTSLWIKRFTKKGYIK